MAPSDHMSLAGVAGAPPATSGARKAGEPDDQAGLREDGVGLQPGDAEVAQLDRPRRGDQQVAGLDVAVHDAGRVGRREGDRGLADQPGRLVRRQGAQLRTRSARFSDSTYSITSQCSSLTAPAPGRTRRPRARG